MSTITRAPTPTEIEAKLETYTPAAVALATGVATTIASWLVDSYGSRAGRLVLAKSDGSRVSRHVHVRHDGTVSADATAAKWSSSGLDAHADFAAGAWLSATVSGSGTAQVVNLKVTAAANGASWTATFYPDFLKAA